MMRWHSLVKIGSFIVIIYIFVFPFVIFAIYQPLVQQPSARHQTAYLDDILPNLPPIREPETVTVDEPQNTTSTTSTSVQTREVPKYAYATLCTDDKFLELALVMTYTLKQTGTPYPLILLATPSLTEAARKQLGAVGAQIIDVPKIKKPPAPRGRGARTFRADRENVFTKLNIWLMTEYDKVLFLDTDILILKSIDDLFDIDIKENEIAAALYCNYHCDCATTWNSGVMLLKPSERTFNQMIRGFEELQWGGQGDQSYLNAFFRARGKLIPISHSYNMGKNVARCSLEMWKPSTFRAFHFAGNDQTHPNSNTTNEVNEFVFQNIPEYEPRKRERIALAYYQGLWKRKFAEVKSVLKNMGIER